MSIFDNIQTRNCEANKKVSYRQRGSIQTKKAMEKIAIEGFGLLLPLVEGEIIESALFERITRDCKGEVIRETSVRRFRKIGSDEWFSSPASEGNKHWETSFADATEEEILGGGKKNEEKSGVKTEAIFGDNEAKVGDEILPMPKKASSPKKTNPIMYALAIGAVIILGYKFFNK